MFEIHEKIMKLESHTESQAALRASWAATKHEQDHKSHLGGWVFPSPLQVWGLGVSLAIYSTAEASGAHLNPAITLAFQLVSQPISWAKKWI